MIETIKVLVVGFGGMGCRHAQSMLNSDFNVKIDVLEPYEDIFITNLVRIGAEKDGIKRYSKLAEIVEIYNFCIIATSSEPRFEIVKHLLNIGNKCFLLEKVVFQSKFQFDEAIELAKVNEAKLYCNFVNRYYTNYTDLKNDFKTEIISMSVIGGNFGLACNGLHYIDLMEYLVGETFEIVDSKLVATSQGNRRGSQYKEVTGMILMVSSSGHRLLISDNPKRTGGNEISICSKNRSVIINEESLSHLEIYSNNVVEEKKFEILYTSVLTKIIYRDISKGKCRLPTIEETKNAHLVFFNAINKAFGLDTNENTPIT